VAQDELDGITFFNPGLTESGCSMYFLSLRQWIADFFEPIRKKYYTKLGMPPAASWLHGCGAIYS